MEELFCKKGLDINQLYTQPLRTLPTISQRGVTSIREAGTQPINKYSWRCQAEGLAYALNRDTAWWL